MNTNDEEQQALQRGRARFEADVAQTVRIIAERYRATGATLTGDAARAILEGALADVGLASRWPEELLAGLAESIAMPSGSTPLTAEDAHCAEPLAQPVIEAFSNPTVT